MPLTEAEGNALSGSAQECIEINGDRFVISDGGTPISVDDMVDMIEIGTTSAQMDHWDPDA